jgi:hypothetical protein
MTDFTVVGVSLPIMDLSAAIVIVTLFICKKAENRTFLANGTSHIFWASALKDGTGSCVTMICP